MWEERGTEMGLWLRGTCGSLVPFHNSSTRLPSDFFIMVMAVLDFVLIQINSLSYSFYNHSLFRILKVFKSMRALRAIRVLRRLRSLPPRDLDFQGVHYDLFQGGWWVDTMTPCMLKMSLPRVLARIIAPFSRGAWGQD